MPSLTEQILARLSTPLSLHHQGLTVATAARLARVLCCLRVAEYLNRHEIITLEAADTLATRRSSASCLGVERSASSTSLRIFAKRTLA